jgi:hypothetical protein
VRVVVPSDTDATRSSARNVDDTAELSPDTDPGRDVTRPKSSCVAPVIREAVSNAALVVADDAATQVPDMPPSVHDPLIPTWDLPVRFESASKV